MLRAERCQTKLLELHFHIPQAVLFSYFRFKDSGVLATETPTKI
jgi:hypothetical protein